MHSTIQFELHFVFTKTSFWFLNWVAQYGFVIGPSWVSLTLSLTTKYSKRRKAESESRLWVSSQRADGSSFCSKTQLFDRGSSREPSSFPKSIKMQQNKKPWVKKGLYCRACSGITAKPPAVHRQPILNPKTPLLKSCLNFVSLFPISCCLWLLV